MSIASPVRFNPDVENVEPDEEKIIADINLAFDTILEKTAEDYGHAVRSVHAKAHGILEGTLTIKDGLPHELAQGLFANPATHQIYMRISTNAGDILPDAVSLPRGLALKILDVKGERLPDAEGTTQDFVMVNGPVFQKKTAKDFLGGLKLLAKTTDRMEGTKEFMSTVLQGVNTVLETVGISSPAVQAMGGAPNVDPLGETYFSVTPFRFGDYIAKFRVRPLSPELTALTGREIDPDVSENAIRETVQAEMKTIRGEWAFEVQLCRDLDLQPTEDPTVEWSEDSSPFEPVAILKAAPQDTWDAEKVREVDEQMRFSIWTGLAAHQPLGNVNRARNATYKHSAEFRQRFNHCPIHEPSSGS